MRSHPYPAGASALLLAAALMAGCGAPPEVAPTPAGSIPAPDTPGTPPLPTPAPPSHGTATPTDPGTAVDCAGHPEAEPVLALLHDADLLAAGVEPDLLEGPLCADDWHYTVIEVPDRDPLQVVTSGPADDLTLVTAGTDVCTVEVRVHAPGGIRLAAGCVS